MNTKKEVKVSGHLEAIGGVYHMKLSWIDDAGKRRRKHMVRIQREYVYAGEQYAANAEQSRNIFVGYM